MFQNIPKQRSYQNYKSIDCSKSTNSNVEQKFPITSLFDHPGFSLYSFFSMGIQVAATLTQTALDGLSDRNNDRLSDRNNDEYIQSKTDLDYIERHSLHPICRRLSWNLTHINPQRERYPAQAEIKCLDLFEETIGTKNYETNFKSEKLCVKENMLYLVEYALKHFSIDNKKRLEEYQNRLSNDLGLRSTKRLGK